MRRHTGGMQPGEGRYQIGGILHWMRPRDHRDHDAVGRDAENPAKPILGLRPLPVRVQIEPIGDDHRPRGIKAYGPILLHRHPGIVDDRLRPP